MKKIEFEGIRPDSLGNYFVALGLLSATAQKWPNVRGCWRNGKFVIACEDFGDAKMEDYLLNKWKPTQYERWWRDIQKKDTKAKTDQGIWLIRSKEVIDRVRVLDAHIVGNGRNQFNPILGTGGNIGKRDLAKAFDEATGLLKKAKPNTREGWLNATLYGRLSAELPKLSNSGTWFVFANKTYNSGQDWYREGQISPWSFLLALEGAILLVGGINKRLSAKARAYAAFPFITERPSPKSEGEVGMVKAEFWAPLWQYPANIAEVKGLLERGLARVGNKAARAPHEFAVAAISAGADAGVSSFARFMLRQTTSSQVYEAIPAEHVKAHEVKTQESKLIEFLLPWIQRLPFEPVDSKQKGKFKGLRGPVESAIIQVAAKPDDPERWQRLLLLLADTLQKLDRNQKMRETSASFALLEPVWFDKCWPTPLPEIRIASAIASIGASGEMPIALNIFGVEKNKKDMLFFSNQRHQRAVWHNGNPIEVFCDVLQRRLIDTDATAPAPFDAKLLCSTNDIAAFLSAAVDLELIQRWVPALSLIKWNWGMDEAESRESEFDGFYLVHSFFRPLFFPSKLRLTNGAPLFPDLPGAAMLRRLLNLIKQQDWSEAVQLAQNRYLAAGQATIAPPKYIRMNGSRLAASLLIPLHAKDVLSGLWRWLQPAKIQSEVFL